MSANQLADACGIPQTTISRLIKGTIAAPNIDTLAKLADYFSISVSQLIGESPLKTDNTLAEIEMNFKAMDMARQRTALNIIRTIAAEPPNPYKGN
jgi:transcriptional regulator with XRE-family HTH domain